ncbi:MAG TPA: DUF488 family protein [Chitinophagaceae bacterium]|jgi:uncharacterized protein YeaO (DUF488 family)
MSTTIKIKRVYEQPEKTDGYRVLVDRLWPRGMTKEKAAIEDWEKELAPSPELRTWFGHKPELWQEFQERYKAELKKNEYIDSFVKKHKTSKLLTLLYAGKDEDHTHAVLLKKHLEHLFTK